MTVLSLGLNSGMEAREESLDDDVELLGIDMVVDAMYQWNVQTSMWGLGSRLGSSGVGLKLRLKSGVGTLFSTPLPRS